MGKTVAIHQPNFIPWIGYFYKWLNCDLFVMLDDVQFSSNSFVNRNKIKTPQGEQWVTIPIIQKGHFGQKINDAKILPGIKWAKKVLGSLKMNYSNSHFYSKYNLKLSELLLKGHERLAEVNISLLNWISHEIGINVPFVRSSGIKGVKSESTQRLISICVILGADNYYSGFGGVNYQNENLFKKEGIKLIKSDFIHPVYEQRWGEFISNLSILDLLFNCGPKSKDIILYNN